MPEQQAGGRKNLPYPARAGLIEQQTETKKRRKKMNISEYCSLFNLQEEDELKKKNLNANLTAVIEKLISMKVSNLCDLSDCVRFSNADNGVDFIMTRYKTDRGMSSGDKDDIAAEEKIRITDYNIYTKAKIEEIIKQLIVFFKIDFGDKAYTPETVMKMLELSEKKRKDYLKTKCAAEDTKYLCDIRDLASYIMFASRIRKGVNVVRFNGESLNVLLFYMRAVSLTCGYGPLFEGEVSIRRGNVVTPASEFINTHKHDKHIYCNPEYESIKLNETAKEIADTVLAMIPEGEDPDKIIKRSLDYHQCFTYIVTDEEIIADFSTWKNAQRYCKEKLKELGGSVYNQLALPADVGQ